MRYRHKKRGTEYVLIGVGKMQAEDWYLPGAMEAGPSVDMREVAIYRSVDDGSLWVRPREEFEDGRFEALASHEPAPTDTQEVVSEAGAEKRNIWECANQLLGYIDQSTPEDLANFLRREGHAAADLAQSITDAQSDLTACQQEVERLREKVDIIRAQASEDADDFTAHTRDLEARNAELVEALESCPSDADFANAEGFRQAINSWWNITARAALEKKGLSR